VESVSPSLDDYPDFQHRNRPHRRCRNKRRDQHDRWALQQSCDNPGNVHIHTGSGYERQPHIPRGQYRTCVHLTYNQYTTALTADSTANPLNTPLSTAVANLGTGNDANGANNVVIDFGHALMLSQYGLQAPAPGIPTINLNSAWPRTSTPFSFTSSVTNTQYDAIGVLEHELDEVLGGGGAGSLLPEALDSSCTGPSPGPFCNTFGATDLYRYASPGTPSFTTSSSATAYLSFDGGATSIAGFNQGAAPPAGCPGGDYGDFAPNGTGAGQLIQNACNTTGSYEAYTTSSPEFAMEEAIGWDPAAPAPVPEPGALAMLGTSLLGLVALRRQR